MDPLLPADEFARAAHQANTRCQRVVTQMDILASELAKLGHGDIASQIRKRVSVALRDEQTGVAHASV